MAVKITSLYKNYFQKSRTFLYPALGIRRGSSFVPIETYMAWEGKYQPEDRKFCCVYENHEAEDFRIFEKQKIRSNKLFYDAFLLEDRKLCYVFDFDSLAEDWDNVLNGRYSKISQEHVKAIRNFLSNSESHLAYVDSFLNPSKYYELYSDLMGVSVKELKNVGELCDKPNFEKETLKVKELDLKLFEG